MSDTELEELPGIDDEHYKRRVLLIHPELQMRLVKVLAGMTLLGMLTQALLFGALVFSAARSQPDGGQGMIEALPSVLSIGFLVTVVLILPALFAVGIRSTFPIAGPIYRFLTYLVEVAERGYQGPVSLREGDELQDLCGAINSAFEAEQARRGEAPASELSGEKSRSAA